MERNRPIAISACIGVVIISGLSTQSLILCSVQIVLITIVSYCWIKFGISRPWRPKEIRHKHTYVYYGCADHQKMNLSRLLLGELRIKSSEFGMIEIKRHYRESMFRIDVITDELVVGAEYFGDVSIPEEQSIITITTLKRVK